MKIKTLSLSIAFAALIVASVPAEAANLFVMNSTNYSTVGEYNATTGETINASVASGPGSNPYGIAASGNDLFVATNNFGSGGTIGKYDATTGTAINANFIPGLTPLGIAVLGNSLFVGSSNGTIGEYNATTGAVINANLISGLFDPFNIVVSGNNLFVVGGIGTNTTIGKYTTSGETVNSNLITFRGQSSSLGIAVSGNDLFVTPNYLYSGPGTTVGKYDATTGAAINTSFISGLNAPEGIAILGNSLYVVNNGTRTIGEYDATTGVAINASLVSLVSNAGYNPFGIVIVDVPEPSSVLGLLGFGTIGGFAILRRRRSNKKTANCGSL